MLAGMVKAPTAFDPTTTAGYPQARRPAQLRHPEHGARSARSPRQQADAGQGDQAQGARASAPRTAASPPTSNSWGFFCDYFYRWWMQQETFGSTSYDRERRLKSGGYTHHHHRSTCRRRRAPTRRSAATRARPPRTPLMVAAVEPGTGRVRALAVNRQLQARRPEAPAEQDLQRPEEGQQEDPGQLPEHGQPAAHRRRRHHRLPGRLDVQDLHAWSRRWRRAIPLSYTINAPEQFKSEYIIDSSSPAACPGTHFYCPSNAVEGDGRRAQHVERLRRLGQHLLRAAPAAGRRGERGRRPRKRLGITVPGVAATPALADQGGRAPVGRVHPGRLRRPPRWNWPTRTPRWPPTASTASRSRCRRSATRTATSSTSPTRTASRRSAPRWPGPPWTPPAARSATTRRTSQVRRQRHRRRRPRHRRHAGGRQVRHHRRGEDRRAGRDDQAVRGGRHHGRPGLAADQRSR